MAKNDVVVRTAADLERKYNFASLLGLKKNVEITAQGIQKIENELNSMLNALVINLKDVLDSQSEISLWFYSSKPTLTNEPYTSWATPSDHIGDICYDQSSGYVYQYKEYEGKGVWEINADPNLVEAMAVTNAETDTSSDHERKVFFDTPTIPYSNGDWWVKEDGSLSICQISKTTGTYEESDFINSSKYTESIAVKMNNEITVLKGTVTMISENFAKFTDLATGGSTTINGDNITTGNIQSNNYVQNVSGMKIFLEDGQIDSKNLKLLENGDLVIGGYIRTDKGILCNFQYNSGTGVLGQTEQSYNGLSIIKPSLEFNISIPEGFEIESAIVNIYVFKTQNIFNDAGNTVTNYGKVQNIKLYKENSGGYYTNSYLGTFEKQGSLSEITGAFGTNGYTNPKYDYAEFSSKDIKSSINSSGNTVLVVQTGDALLDISTSGNGTLASKQTQIAFGTVDITGYMAYED